MEKSQSTPIIRSYYWNRKNKTTLFLPNAFRNEGVFLFLDMLKIGHRGAKGHVAENTLASFEKALQLHVDVIELDVHLSSDQKIMVIHDESIDRTTNGTGLVNNWDSEKLQQFGIPTLEEVLDLINQQCVINIEIKDVKATGFVVELIEKYISEKQWNYNHFQISCFDWYVLESVSKANPKILIGVLAENNLDKAYEFAKKINAHSVNPFYQLLTKEKVTLLHENGLLVFPWTVNEPDEITLLKSFKVDGIISDFPDRL